ncbi:MAG TPA: hypothetical protein G4O03_03760 [Dehalococcoidia bacterium]|nr:hypothetical protein [Dehalococcoidia bacterium]
MSAARWRLSLTLALLVLLGTWLATPFPGNAQTPSSQHRLTPDILVPSEPGILSGGAWLLATGQHPALDLDGRFGDGVGEPTEVGLQAVGPAAAALIPYRDPSAKFSRTILVSRDLGRLPFQTGPHLDVHPKDPDHLVMVLMDYNFPGIVSYVSIDGGATWEGPNQPRIPRGELTGVGDPVVAFDREGRAYTCQMSVRIEDFLLGPLVGSALIASIPVSRSSDGGFSWEETILASQGGVGVWVYATTAEERLRGEVEVRFLDKPWIRVGPHPENPDQDIIYVTYTNFIDRWKLLWVDELPVLDLIEEQAVIELVRSEDGGQTWSRPVEVSPRVQIWGGGEIARRVVQGSQPLVGRDGTLYVAWFDSGEDGVWKGTADIWVAASEDGGRTFSRPRLAARFLEVGFRPRSASFRLWGTGLPQMALGSEGEVYIAYTAHPTDNPEDGGDVFLVRSLDGGRTWGRRVRVSDDMSQRIQFFPALAVDPEGTIHMIWGDTRDDPTELSYHIYYSCSKDRGQTWELNSRVSDFPSNPNFAFPRGRYIGDYFSIAATAEDVYITWADSRLGELGGYNQKIGFARKRLMPIPSIFISPPSGPASRDIVIQGHHFQPETEVFVEIGGVIAATGRTQEDGTFSIRLFVPITGEGAQTVQVKDISGNVATVSFFTEFGFDSFQEAITRLESQLAELGEGGVPPPTESPTPTAAPALETPPSQSFLWLAVALAGALALALAGLAVVLFRLYAKGR